MERKIDILIIDDFDVDFSVCSDIVQKAYLTIIQRFVEQGVQVFMSTNRNFNMSHLFFQQFNWQVCKIENGLIVDI